MKEIKQTTISIDHRGQLSLAEVGRYALLSSTRVELASSDVFRHFIEANRLFCESEFKRGADIYGVTTGFGESSRHRIDQQHALQLQKNLSRYHGCGVGPYLSEAQCAATLLIRLNCNARGYSGVSWSLLEQLCWLADQRLIPAIPALGSVGASGDLTPLSYVAACLQGERSVYVDQQIRSTKEIFSEHQKKPYQLQEKEGLAIMNGTSVMTAIASLAWLEAKRLADLACSLTGLAIEAVDGRSSPFDPRLHALKPHPGQVQAAKNIAHLIASPASRLGRPNGQSSQTKRSKLQDYYSLRCAPQVIGVLYDVLEWSKRVLEIEMNSVNDNPLFLHEAESVLNGGQFYGGHVAAACDALKTAAANVVSLLDRQLAILMDERFNDVLPDNLVDRKSLGDEAFIHHGFKAMQISMTALTAEALKASLPMSVFARPTENSNQDVVSMGTIAARDLSHVMQLA